MRSLSVGSRWSWFVRSLSSGSRWSRFATPAVIAIGSAIALSGARVTSVWQVIYWAFFVFGVAGLAFNIGFTLVSRMHKDHSGGT
jgi:hypothetical protein